MWRDSPKSSVEIFSAVTDLMQLSNPPTLCFRAFRTLLSTGPLQVCAGQDGGCEAAVHAMRQFFAEPEVQGALLVDASNAFNTINRQSALHNIKSICPPPLPDTHEHIQSSSKMHFLWRRGDHLFRRYYTGGPASHGYVCACCETTNWGTEVGCPRCETSMVRGRCHRCRHL